MQRTLAVTLFVCLAIAIGAVVVRERDARKKLTAVQVEFEQLEQQKVHLQHENQRLTDQVAQQRELLREQTLKTSRRSVDEFLALFPAPFPAGDWRPAESRFEDCWFLSADGLRLHGWQLRQSQPNAAILHLHGNAGNLSHRGAIAEKLSSALNASVMLFDYRGYGRSEGTPTIEGLLHDARAARREIAEREGVAESEVVLLGESLGGAIAVDLAARDGARALILENTFSSLRDVASVHYPAPLVSMVLADKLNSVDQIGRYQGPVFQVHGTADSVVPLRSAQKLHSAANEPKTFLVLPGHNHNDPLPNQYYEALRRFITALPKSG